MNKKKLKVCLVSSCGGHFMELMQLLPAMEDKEFYIVTERNVASTDVLKNYRHHYLLQQERRHWNFAFRFTVNIMLSTFYLLKETPDIIITTGAGASYPTCRIGKMIGKKVIYIESFAKIDSESVTGRMVYPFADYFFVQWESMLKIYPKAIYKGGLY